MPILKIDHIQLAMPAGAEDTARRFYRDILGLPERPKPPHLAKRGGCWFESDRVKVHLGIDPHFTPSKKAHPGLLVSGLQDIAKACRAAGFPVIDDEPLDGFNRVYIQDPFGNRIELMEPLSPLSPAPNA